MKQREKVLKAILRCDIPVISLRYPFDTNIILY